MPESKHACDARKARVLACHGGVVEDPARNDATVRYASDFAMDAAPHGSQLDECRGPGAAGARGIDLVECMEGVIAVQNRDCLCDGRLLVHPHLPAKLVFLCLSVALLLELDQKFLVRGQLLPRVVELRLLAREVPIVRAQFALLGVVGSLHRVELRRFRRDEGVMGLLRFGLRVARGGEVRLESLLHALKDANDAAGLRCISTADGHFEKSLQLLSVHRIHEAASSEQSLLHALPKLRDQNLLLVVARHELCVRSG
mmetsp:Transcript_126421/g.363646  ORF Transcript_126421/g.363646 Transcript_126421/m.363646 type:complete len:257 (+) Transcript_126421:1004-1774(+)